MLSGDVKWSGGFEPFGRDWQEGTPQNATDGEVFLPLPGQWVDEAWEEASLGVPLYYNVYRFLEVSTARFTRPDPLTFEIVERARYLNLAPSHAYAYVGGRPLTYLDPFGLAVEICQRPNEIPEFEGVPILDDLPHQWFRTPFMEAGLGPWEGGVPGREIPGCRCQDTTINNHAGEGNEPGSTCRVIGNVEETCVNVLLGGGLVESPSLGWWLPGVNDCWTFTARVIAHCRIDQPMVPRTEQPPRFMPPPGGIFPP